MSVEPRKVECENCDWQGDQDALLTATHPFDPDDTVHGCPRCKSVDCFVMLCDEPGCTQQVSCGWPTKDGGGYRNTCHIHSDWFKSRQA